MLRHIVSYAYWYLRRLGYIFIARFRTHACLQRLKLLPDRYTQKSRGRREFLRLRDLYVVQLAWDLA